MSFYSKDIQSIHLELTDRCNLSCPQCGRNKLGGEENPFLPGAEINLSDIKKMLEPTLLKSLKRIYACGNYGDPILAKDTLEIFSYFRDSSFALNLGMNTNGSARDTSWWSSLGRVFGDNGEIKFGIDGLEDTNQIYRKGSDFNKIIKNAEAFINSGGRATWEYIVFKHNEYQVEKARELSESIGFKKFTVKKTGRFFSNTKVKTNDFQQVLKNDGSLDYIIEKPEQEKYQNKSLKKEQDIISQFGSMDNYLNETPVDCKVAKESSVYISSEGLLFPCCWTANQLYLWYMPKGKGQIWDMVNKNNGLKSLDLKKRNFYDILKSGFYEDLKNSWNCSSVANGKSKVCSKTCGTLFDQFRDQYK